MWKMNVEYDEGEATPNATPLFELGHVHKFARLGRLGRAQ